MLSPGLLEHEDDFLRGVFFAARIRLTMATTLVVFVGGGYMLSLSESYSAAWFGFMLLFVVAALGRLVSAALCVANARSGATCPCG